MPIPLEPKIYHIVHVDRLASIISDGLLCDAAVQQLVPTGTTIGMNTIKSRRLNELELRSHPGLRVGACVPFYFCPRSVMLYIIYKGNDPDLQYRGGQEPIVHLECDLIKSVAWAESIGLRWAFTLSNAGSRYFEDRANLDQLGEIDWDAVQATDWQHCKEGKQAEFLIEQRFPWELVSRIGVASKAIMQQALAILRKSAHQPSVEIRSEWYY
jgi:hypothetical protein